MIKCSGAALFTAVLLSATGLIIFVSADLSPLARLVPLAVAIPTFAILLWELLQELFPAWGDHTLPARGERSDLTAAPNERNRLRSGRPAESPLEEAEKSGEIKLFLWLFMLIACVQLLGFLVVFPLFAFLYFKLYLGEGWRFSLVMAAAMWGMLYGGYVRLLNGPLHTGDLWLWLAR